MEMRCDERVGHRLYHCGVCTENCEFLKKYDLTIGDTEKLSKMAYHCFLCGKCSKVCPQGIDGREIVLQIRRHRVKEAGGRIPEKGYGMLLWEKEDYKFRRYTGTGKTALFFGCNFPSFYRRLPVIWGNCWQKKQMHFLYLTAVGSR